jgi:hypothetical protein
LGVVIETQIGFLFKSQQMKHFLLLLSFVICISLLSAQSSYNSVSSISSGVELSVFPNPATDYFKVSENNWVQTIAVYNLAGRKVSNFTYADDLKYDVSNLPKGMYLIQMLDFHGQTLGTRRISIR